MRNTERRRWMLRALSLIPIAAVFSGCVAPREAYVGSIKAFSDASDSLAVVANPVLDAWRTSQRALIFRSALTNKILAPRDTDLDRQLIRGEFSLLCLSREEYAQLRGAQTYLAATGKALGTVAGDPPKDLGKLVEALTNNYTISLALSNDHAAVTAGCRTDLERYVNTAYPRSVKEAREELAISAALAAGKAALDLIQQVVVPLATRAAQEVDSARRASALQTFLSDTKFQKDLQESIDHLADLLKQTQTQGRRMKVKEFMDSLNGFGASMIAADKILADPKSGCLKIRVPKDDKDDIRLTSEFQQCYAAVWTEWQPQITKILTAAADYDVEADKYADETAANLKKISSKLADIAAGKMDQDTARATLQAGIRLAGLAKDIHAAAASAENQKKVKVVMDQLEGALKK